MALTVLFVIPTSSQTLLHVFFFLSFILLAVDRRIAEVCCVLLLLICSFVSEVILHCIKDVHTADTVQCYSDVCFRQISDNERLIVPNLFRWQTNLVAVFQQVVYIKKLLVEKPPINLFVTWKGMEILTFRHRASCILGKAFHYSTENAFYIFNQQIYFITWYLLDRASLI